MTAQRKVIRIMFICRPAICTGTEDGKRMTRIMFICRRTIWHGSRTPDFLLPIDYHPLPRFAAICRVRPVFPQECTISPVRKSRQNVALWGIGGLWLRFFLSATATSAAEMLRKRFFENWRWNGEWLAISRSHSLRPAERKSETTCIRRWRNPYWRRNISALPTLHGR
jgi:hypothetical protein